MRISSFVATVVAAPMLLLGAGCGGSVSKSDFKATLVNDAKLSEPVADCVTEELFRKLDDQQIEHVYTAELSELTTAERRAVSAAAVLCVSGGRATRSTTGTTTGQ